VKVADLFIYDSITIKEEGSLSHRRY
jgi:hypothetical protein